jgi:hypothetical protein
MEALLRVRAEAEGARKAADGWRQGCAPGRCRVGAALLGHTPAQATHPAGGRQKVVWKGQTDEIGIQGPIGIDALGDFAISRVPRRHSRIP